MSEWSFEIELDRLILALRENETRVDLMALFVTKATTLADIARSLDLELAAISYHSHVLESLGAVERQQDGRWAATELGILAYTEYTRHPST